MSNIVDCAFFQSIIERKDDETSTSIEDTLTQLAQRILDNQCYAFCGAGVSMSPPSELPSWKQLLSMLLNVLCDEFVVLQQNREHLEALLRENDLVTAAELLQASLPFNNFQILTRELNNILKKRDRESGAYLAGPVEPNETHFLIARLMFRHILTTNYDELLSDADSLTGMRLYQSVDRAQPSDLEAPLLRSDRLIVYVHGRLQSASTIVLTRTQLNRAYGRSFFNDWLIQSLIQRSFLFLGYSLSDFDFVNLIRSAREQLSPDLPIGPHFAVLPWQSFPPILGTSCK